MDNKINKGHYHEAIDRIAVMQNNIEDNLRNYPLINKKKKFLIKLIILCINIFQKNFYIRFSY